MKAPSVKTKRHKPGADFKGYLLDKLKDREEACAYLNEAFQRSLEDGDGSVFQLALRDVAEAQGGMAQLAKKSGMPRESVYRVLSKDRDPRFGSILRLSKPLGFTLAGLRRSKLLDHGINKTEVRP